MRHDSSICVMAHRYETCSYIHPRVPWLVHRRSDTHSYMWYDSFIRDAFLHTWLIHMCHDVFACPMIPSHVPWLIHRSTETHSYVSWLYIALVRHFPSYMTPSWHVPWRIHMRRDSFTRATTHSHRSRETHAYVFWSIHMRQGFTHTGPWRIHMRCVCVAVCCSVLQCVAVFCSVLHTGPWRIHMRCVFIWDVDVSHMSNDSRDQHMSHMMLETNTCLIWHEQTLYRRIHVWCDMTRHFTHESGPVLINMFQINWGGHVWMSLSTSVIESWPMWNSHGTCDWLLC